MVNNDFIVQRKKKYRIYTFHQKGSPKSYDWFKSSRVLRRKSAFFHRDATRTTSDFYMKYKGNCTLLQTPPTGSRIGPKKKSFRRSRSWVISYRSNHKPPQSGNPMESRSYDILTDGQYPTGLGTIPIGKSV
jgi:hypothetical protein